jgi:hypothetical protein
MDRSFARGRFSVPEWTSWEQRASAVPPVERTIGTATVPECIRFGAFDPKLGGKRPD